MNKRPPKRCSSNIFSFLGTLTASGFQSYSRALKSRNIVLVPIKICTTTRMMLSALMSSVTYAQQKKDSLLSQLADQILIFTSVHLSYYQQFMFFIKRFLRLQLVRVCCSSSTLCSHRTTLCKNENIYCRELQLFYSIIVL